MKFAPLLAALAATACLVTTHAGPLDERAAIAHVEAIASSEVDKVMEAYGDDPFVEWVGGAVDGRYHGKDAVRSAWAKFMAVNESQPRTVVRTAFVQNANPSGVTLVANVEYSGKVKVRVRQALVYREGKLVTEIWQIDPKAELTPAGS